MDSRALALKEQSFERTFLSKRIRFKKVTIMLKDWSPKLKGRLCNITVLKVDRNWKYFPRPARNNNIVIVKPK